MPEEKMKFPTPNDDVSIAQGDVKHLDRDSRGRFLKGNSVKKYNTPEYQRLFELRQLWWNAVTDDRMVAVIDGLYSLALDCDDPRIRLAAQLNILDRSIGKPAENINLNVSESGNLARPVDVELDDDELALLERVVRKTRPVATKQDGEEVVIDVTSV